ncbi:MAG: choice-of-anchor Q domain-containing protein, partial [Nitrospirales bacterium]
MLGALADNGGPTWTHALLAGSPALNAGTTIGAPAVDQRGLTRDAAPDIGAYEYKSTAFVSKNEFMVNDPSGNNEVTSGPVRGAERAVDIAPNGDYVVVWTNGTANDKVYAKVLDASGNQKVAQFQVNIGGGTNNWTDVAVDDSGNFIVVWNQGNDIFMRRFLANGTAVDAGDMIVNTGTSNTQQNSSVNMNGDGDFVIAWEGNGTEGIFVRQGSFGGGLVGSDITVNTAAAAKDPSVGIDDSGNFVVVWDNGSDVFFQLYNSAGVPQNSGQVDVLLQLNAGSAAVDMSGDGRFTVAYRATVLDVDVYVRQFDASGNPLFLPRTANTSSLLSTQTNPSITMDDIGEFIVVWEGTGNQAGQSDAAGVFGQKFNASGQKIGFEFLINQTTANTQDRASVAMLDRDNFVAVWTGSDGTQTDVFARQYGATSSPTLDLDANNSSGSTGNDYAFTFTEGDGPTAIADSDTNLSDVDSTTFAYVTLSVSGLLDGNAEVLILDGDTFALATDAPGQDTSGGNYHVRLSTAAGTAIISITKQGGGTLSEIETETLIKAIQYQHTDTSNPSDGNRLIEVRVNDGTTDSAAARTTINVDPVNDPPAFSSLDNTPTFVEGGTAIVLDGNATMADPDLDAANNYNGAILTLVRNGGANAEDMFAHTGTLNAMTEGSSLVLGGTSIGTVTTNSGGTLVLTFNGNATTALVNSALQQITYANSSATPPATVQIDFTINDGNAGAQGSGGALNGTGSITVTILPTNTPPVAMADSFTVNEGSTNTLNLAGNDTDPDDPLDLTSITIISGPANGTIDRINNDGTVDYTHNGSETLSDSFTYTIRDLTGATSNTVTVSLTVIPINDAPIIISNRGGASANVSVITGNTMVTDVDATDAESNPLTYSIIGGADAAKFTIDPATGALRFITPPNIQSPSDVGADNVYDVTVQVSDGALTDTQAIAVTVTNVPPVVILPPPDPTPDPHPDTQETEQEGDTTIGGSATASSSADSSNGSQGSTADPTREIQPRGRNMNEDFVDSPSREEDMSVVEAVSDMVKSLKE